MEEWRFDGFPGRVLFVNLSSGTVEARSIPHAWCLEGMGGKGLATRVLVEWDTTEPAAYDLVHPVTGGSDVARHPSTPLLVFTGPFQGTKVGSAGRAVVVSRSPLTDVYIDTYVGGNLGHRLREAGWDGLFVTGASDALVRLEISDLEARLVPCPELEGATTWACEQALDGLGECFSIGPGGEAGVRFASPITAGRRAAGRGGTGAQFGFKRLKAITVHASAEARQLARIHDSDALVAAVKIQRQEMGLKRRAGDPFYAFGTSRGPLYASANDRMPTANYTAADGVVPSMADAAVAQGAASPSSPPVPGMSSTGPVALDTHRLSGEHWHDEHPDAKQSGCCAPCPIACEAADRPTVDGVRTKGRPVHVNRVERPEYETLAMMGSNLGLTSSLDVMDGNDACNRLGLDTISSGAALSLVCELAERGWLPEAWGTTFAAPFAFGPYAEGDAVTWRFGDPALPPLALAGLCTAQPGDGSLFGALHGGAVAFAKVVESMTGHPATRCTAHCKGLDLPAWDPRGKRGNALAYMTANVGASHMRAGYKAPTGLPKDSALDLVPELIESQNAIVVRDSLILCAFAKGASPDAMLAEAWTAITGDEATWADLCARAGVQWDLARAWNVAHWRALGRDAAEEDLLSWRLRKEPLPSGVAKGCVSFQSDDDEAACLSAYYRLRGWDASGRPEVKA